ncbi:hypothetical protein BGW37DRAFT_471640 [Umbelopsis sp. PMI_123]|nr:hypothetical protein BGW37DRAFT_471640 [Umbelopsis sp. PMI_123]
MSNPADSGYLSDKDQAPPKAVSRSASTMSLISGHAKSSVTALIRFIFKNNNLPLLLNLLHHSVAARYLLTTPYSLLRRYTQQSHQTVIAPAATDMLRSLGGLHMSLAGLSLLSLKYRDLRIEQMSLIILSIANITQLWSHSMAYWRTSGRWNIRILREIGLLELVASVVSFIAYTKSASKSRKLL